MTYVIVAALAFWAGHYVSPSIDGWIADLREKYDPDPSDPRNIDRNDWGSQ